MNIYGNEAIFQFSFLLRLHRVVDRDHKGNHVAEIANTVKTELVMPAASATADFIFYIFTIEW